MKYITPYHSTSWIFFLLIFSGIYFSCQPEDEVIDFERINGLSFSADTVLFDTLFATQGSTTRRLYVYNTGRNALKISSIRLAGGGSSFFNLYINGQESKAVNDEVLLGKDSLLILVQVNIDPSGQDLPFIVKDSIVFETNGQMQDVKLNAWGQDAIFLGNEILPCETVFTKQRPYVIYRPILIDSLCELIIEAGARIYFDRGATMFVQGSLYVFGTNDERVVFNSARPEARFANIPGQWGGIYFLEGSKDNWIEYTTIRNADIGLRLGTPDADTIPDVIVRNTIIENMSTAGILSYTSDLLLENCLLSHCGSITLGNFGGGNYLYNHCTFAYPYPGVVRQSPMSAFSDNIVLDNDETIISELNVYMTNCIINGGRPNEVGFDLSGNTSGTLLFANNLLKTNLEGFDLNDNLLNLNPAFVDPDEYNFRLEIISPAINAGIPTGLLFDIEDESRSDTTPDIGAYEFIE
ncbi:MAG: right-handed parallel beta-helix repeat-containing protein [Cyclobacteriaceae bacterium]